MLGAWKRFSHGLSFEIEYQYTNALSEQPFGITAPMDSTRAHLDRGHADFVAHHVTTANYTWDIPLAQNSRLGGWQLAGIMGFGSGQPFSATADSPYIAGNRANVSGDPTSDGHTLKRWFNTTAFSVPAPFTYGNAARNMLFGPGYFNWDTARPVRPNHVDREHAA